jgi:preprotein translocase subunit SecA
MRDTVRYALSTARGVPIEYDLRPYGGRLKRIRDIQIPASDDALRRMAADVRLRVKAGSPLEAECAAACALISEACRRFLGMRPFDEQIIAGMAMHEGKLAQMQTGEGKTLAAVFPACLNALCGKGVHVLTANDYLARRDAGWMRPVYEAMGLSAAPIGETSGPGERRAPYACDVTYLTAREAGFDFLRDHLCYERGQVVQREPFMAIVDEADFLLIDEARIPLVIAGGSQSDGVDVRRVDAVARGLRPGIDFQADREGRRISILLEGHRRIEEALGVDGMHEERGARCFARVHAALHAQVLLFRDVDYIVRDGRVQLVDELTGRVANERQWPWGIQAAIEAKEGLAVRPEGRIYGRITIHHYVGLYEKLAAMTETAVLAAAELAGFYGLATVIVPPVKPSARHDQPDMLFRTREEKLNALVTEITATHARGRPVLVGTASVRESEELAGLLRREGVRGEVLNASNDEKEAQLIAAAGRLGAVTISTNMAGRGVDIQCSPESVALGGLFVIGTNRHESRRIDDQLRGRAGRQGEPGATRFFISLEDPLFIRYGVREFLPRSEPSPGPIMDPRVLREIDRAQAIIAEQNHLIRKSLQKYSALVELDRRCVQAARDEALRFGRLPASVEEECRPSDGELSAADRDRLVQIYLSRLDSFWADHLALADEVREGINLERFAGRDPGLQYIHRVGEAFERGFHEVEASVCEAWQRAREAPQDGPGEASRPSSTWTYQVDDASPAVFDLSMIATSNIGAAALAAGPLLILKAFAWLWRRITGGRAARGP